MRAFETDGVVLPEDHRTELPTLSYAYGAAHYCARYCGFDVPPSPPRGQMQHGWVRPDCMFDPVYVIWDDGTADPDEYHWISRKDLEGYLRQHGYHRATAIGVGMVYVPDFDVPRLPNSLLVMPGHSLYTTEHDWNFQQYLSEITAIKNDFDHIAVCVHPACLEKGYWIKAFQDAGFEVISGALFAGRHALERMLWMMKRFEYVTGNYPGTNMAYAAYGGAKFSFFGTFLQTDPRDWQNVELFQRRPDVLQNYLRINSEAHIREHYGEFFHAHPKEAQANPEWGRWQLGADNRPSPLALRDLFAWPSGKTILPLSKLPDEQRTAPDPTPLKTEPAQIPTLFSGNAKTDLKAFLALRTRAETGDAHAAYELALIFRHGLYHNCIDPQESLVWIRRAAEGGHTDAQFTLGIAYLTGENVEPNRAEAQLWLALAAQGGCEEATKLLSANASLSTS